MADTVQRTVILIKPDALQRDLLGEIIRRFERKGLKVVGLKLIHPPADLWDEHYKHHVGKDFYKDLKAFMMHAPMVAMALEGVDAVDEVRKIVGATDPRKADAGTIRADYAMRISSNLVHASDSAQAAAEELKRFFKDEEIFGYEKITDRYIFGEGI